MRKFDRAVVAFALVAFAAPLTMAAPAASPQPPAPADTSAAAPAAVPAPSPAAPKLPFPRPKPDPLDEAFSPKAAAAAAASPTVNAVAAAKPLPRAKPLTAVATIPMPRSKPARTTLAMTDTPATAVQAATAAPLVAPPSKPRLGSKPMPRPKPEAVVPATPAAPVAAPTAAPAVVAPTAVSAPAPGDAQACGDACNEILFRTLGDCLWVQNANPRPVSFAAQVGGRTIALPLAGADAGKADAHKPFEPKEGVPSPIGEAAYHTRISDPFSPSAPGIAVYRARLGSASGCVKSRTDITSFSASFVKAGARN